MENEQVAMEVRQLQEDLRSLQSAYISYAEHKCRRENKQRLKNLDSYIKEFDFPEPPKSAVDLKSCSEMDLEKVKNDLKKYINLLQVLILKVDCPKSRIIDEI